jgi:hypothetical protein
MKKAMNIKKLALYGMLIALAMILSYIESLIPVLIPIPGIKLGLANLVVIICLYTLGGRAAIFVSIIRIFLIAFTFGNVAALMFAISGASLSLVCMLIAIKLDKFSTGGISIIGGISHNIGQILVAVIILKNALIFSYLPYLMIAGIVTGLLIGILASLIINRIKPEIDRVEG